MLSILITDPLYGIERLFLLPVAITYKPLIGKEELKKIIGEFDVVICRTRTKIDKEILDRAKKLKAIIVASHSFNNIDVEYANLLGIKVFRTASTGKSVAEYVLGTVLTFFRNFGKADIEMKSGKFNKFNYLGREISNLKIGVIGYGKVGKEIVRLFRKLGNEVLIYDKKYSKNTLDEVLEKSDVIVFAIPTYGENHGIVNKKMFEKMKRCPLIVCISRSLIFNLEDLKEALKNGVIRGLIIDVYEDEFESLKDIISFSNVLATPHIGAQTLDGQLRNMGTILKILRELITSYSNTSIKNPTAKLTIPTATR